MTVAERQRSTGSPVSRDGVGLHSGEETRVTLRPAAPGTGLRFRRVDLEGAPVVPGDVEYVTTARWETVLEHDGATVRGVEHVMAAAAAEGVDNLLVELEGPEPPALDGSAAPWCEAIVEAGVVEQQEPARVLAVDEPFTVRFEDSRYSVVPSDRLRVSAEIDFENRAIGRQFASLLVEPATFRDQAAAARTFGLERWKEPLQSQGLALGASHENTIVVGDDSLAPGVELRYPDEFVRHKLVDMVGDLALVGARLRAHVTAERPGHSGNVEVARRLKGLLAPDARGPALGIEDILEYIPHRYPFLLIDRILEFESGKRILGLKNVTINEPYFSGHFPDHPIMPGVLIVEAMAQAGGLLLMNEFDDPAGKVVYFMSLDDVKFRRPVVPGDQILFELEMLQFRGRVCRMRGTGRVDGAVVAEATMMARVVDR